MNETETTGRVIWITGLSGAGKSTLAQATAEQLRSGGIVPVILDGDAVRDAIRVQDTGHDPAGRLENAWRICRLAQLLARQNHTVLVATMSLFKEVHTWNRVHLPGYFEVYLEAQVDFLRERDPKGLYAKLAQGEIAGVPGMDLDFDEPVQPNLVLGMTIRSPAPESMAETLLQAITANLGGVAVV